VLKDMSKRIREALKRAEEEMEEKKGDSWWNEDCKKKKRLVRGALTEWIIKFFSNLLSVFQS